MSTEDDVREHEDKTLEYLGMVMNLTKDSPPEIYNRMNYLSFWLAIHSPSLVYKRIIEAATEGTIKPILEMVAGMTQGKLGIEEIAVHKPQIGEEKNERQG